MLIHVEIGHGMGRLIPLRHPDLLGPQHPVQGLHHHIQLFAGLGGLHLVQQLVHRRMGKAHAVAAGIVLGHRGPSLFKLRPRLIAAVHRIADDDVEIKARRVNALHQLGRIHHHQLGINAQGAQVFHIGADDAFKGGAVLDELHLQDLALGVAAHPALAHGPARRVQQGRSRAQVLAVHRALHGGHGPHHRLIRQDRRRQQPLVDQRLQNRCLLGARRAFGRHGRVFPDRIDAVVKPIEQRLVRPFKVEHQPDGFAHLWVLELLAPQVEQERLTRGDRPRRQRRLDDLPIGHTRKVIGGRPVLRRVFIAEGIDARLEPFKRRRIIAEILNPDAVEIVVTKGQGVISTPIILIPLVHHLLTGADAVQHIRPGAKEGRQAAFLKIARVAGVIGLGDDGQAARLGRHVAKGGAGGEGELHPVRVQSLNRLELFVEHRPELGNPLVTEELIAEHHILGGHRAAVGKGDIFPQVENHPRPVLRILHRLAQLAIGRADLISGARQDGFVKDLAQRHRSALDGIGVHRIKRARRPLADLATLRGVRIHIGQMREISGKLQRAKGGNAMRHDHRLIGRAALNRPKRRGQTHEASSHNRPQIGACRCRCDVVLHPVSCHL